MSEAEAEEERRARVESDRSGALRRHLGDARYERVYELCFEAHARGTGVRKADLFAVVPPDAYDACLAVEQLVFVDMEKAVARRTRSGPV